MQCYCSSKKEFSECCKPFLDGNLKPNTPEELMRSRYSAYVIGNVDYIINTTAEENRYPDDALLIEEFSRAVSWLKLEVLQSKESMVEFKAYYRDSEGIKVQHEKSSFVYEDNMWLYKDGKHFSSKIERNEPCPCGSGKKYKKCCEKQTTL